MLYRLGEVNLQKILMSSDGYQIYVMEYDTGIVRYFLCSLPPTLSHLIDMQ